MRRTLPVVAVALATLLTGCFGSGPPTDHGVQAKHRGALGIHANRVLFRGTSHCYVPVGQGHPGVCATGKEGGKLPHGFFELGADTSNFQGCVSGSGLGFIIAKRGEGGAGASLFLDRFGPCTWHNAVNRGIPAGNYWFGRDCGSASGQAHLFAQATIGERGSLPGALDFETNDCGLSNQSECIWIRSFTDTYQRETGFRASLVYDAPGLWPGCSFMVRGAKGWVASLGNGCRSVLSGFNPPRMTICQDSFTGPFGGDRDRWWSGSPRDLVAEAHGPPPAPPVPPQIGFDCQRVVKYRAAGHHRPGTYGAWQLAIHRRSSRNQGWGCVPKPHRIRPAHLPEVAPLLVFKRCARLDADLHGAPHRAGEVHRLRAYIAAEGWKCNGGNAHR